MALTRRMGTLLAAITAVLCLGTLGFILIEGYPVADAIYIAVLTMTMVGYMEQLSVSDTRDLGGKTLAEVNVRREFKAIVLAIRRAGGQMVFNPSADARIEAGDSLIVMGEQEPLRRLGLQVAGGSR